MKICPKCSAKCPNSARYCPSCNTSLVQKVNPLKEQLDKMTEEEFKDYMHAKVAQELAQERALQEQKRQETQLNDLRNEGVEGYYEYKAIDMRDPKTGRVELQPLMSTLNEMGRQGWHLLTTFNVEQGSSAAGASIALTQNISIGGGSSVTQGQNMLIFERFIKF